MKKLLLFPLLMLACSAEKPELVAPDYGAEDDAKFDSAHAPASTFDIWLGVVANASFTAKSQYRAFRFSGKKGQKVSLYVDGLKGLDTVAYLYKVSATTGKPYGSALVSNDDTREEGWTVQTNTSPNPLSSSIHDFYLPETRSYAVVATTYDGSTGKAEVVVKSAGCSTNRECATDQYCALESCGGTGTCQTRPQVCIQIYKPVCGCDGKTYGNSCGAAGAGASIASPGPCALSSDDIDDAARAHVYGEAAGQKIFTSESAAVAADQAHPIDGYWLARDGAGFVSGIHDLWAQKFTVGAVYGEITVTAEH